MQWKVSYNAVDEAGNFALPKTRTIEIKVCRCEREPASASIAKCGKNAVVVLSVALPKNEKSVV